MATPFFAWPEISIWGYEGRRDFFDRPKCPQWPFLYRSYEATYTLKCLLFEKIVKNSFLPLRHAKISFWRFSQKVSNLEYMLLHNSYINMAIANILRYGKSLYDHQGPRTRILTPRKPLNGCGTFSRVPTSTLRVQSHDLFTAIKAHFETSIWCRIIIDLPSPITKIRQNY